MLEVNQIYLGDCLEVMKEIDDKSVDLILCDLPYGTTACKWDTIIPIQSLWGHYERIIKPNSAIILNASQPFTSLLISSNLNLFKYCWYWKKRPVNFLNAKKQPLRNIEDIVVFGGKLYKPQDLIFKPRINKRSNSTETNGKHGKDNFSEFTNYPTQLLEITNGERGLHPTQKPIELMEYLIKTYTNEGDLVLDNACGSGSTLVAAKNTKRNYIGIEMDEKFFNISKNRLEQ